MDLRAPSLSRVRGFATPWTVAHQTPLSVEFSRQEYSSESPFPSAGNLDDLGIEYLGNTTSETFINIYLLQNGHFGLSLTLLTQDTF